MLNIVKGIGAEEVAERNLISCIQTITSLFFPQLIFQNIHRGRRRSIEKFAHFLHSICTKGFLIFLPTSDGCALVEVVQFARILNMHFCICGDGSFTQQGIDQFAHFVKRTHRHGVADGRSAWRSQLQNALRIALGVGINFQLRGVVESIGRPGLIGPIVFEIILDGL